MMTKNHITLPSVKFINLFVLLLLLDKTGAWRRRRRSCSAVNCRWSWSDCSASCGGGTQQPVVTSGASCGGSCSLPSSRACNTQCCPVDCVMSAWGPWSACSATCGAHGTKRRSRTVITPASCDGAACPSETEQSAGCNRACYNGALMVADQCMCSTGWEGQCCLKDINECDGEVVSNCHHNATCTNLPGGYNCSCASGYFGNGYHCLDVNECEQNTSFCDENARCLNNNGSFDCICSDGWVGNGTLCNDVNECEQNTSFCDENARCRNNNGSFDCICSGGWVGNGTLCTEEPDTSNLDAIIIASVCVGLIVTTTIIAAVVCKLITSRTNNNDSGAPSSVPDVHFSNRAPENDTDDGRARTVSYVVSNQDAAAYDTYEDCDAIQQKSVDLGYERAATASPQENPYEVYEN